MSIPHGMQPEEAVAEKILRRAELGKIARCLQNRLALAHFKTKRGWEDLTLDKIEPKYEEEVRRKRLAEGDVLSDSSSSASDLIYPSRTLMGSPLNKGPIFSDAVGSSNGSSTHGQRKRSFVMSFDEPMSSPTKRLRSSPPGFRASFPAYGDNGPASWRNNHMTQSSPIKPRRQPHFTTSIGPSLSFSSRAIAPDLASSALTRPDEDDDDPIRLQTMAERSSPPSTPPTRTRASTRKQRAAKKDSLGSNSTIDDNNAGGPNAKGGEECADLLLYFAASPSPANPRRQNRTLQSSTAAGNSMEPPSTPPHRSVMGLPSAMMSTPGGNNGLFSMTPGPHFDLADFVNMTPSPAQKPWKTPQAGAAGGMFGSVLRTPRSAAKRRLTFDTPN